MSHLNNSIKHRFIQLIHQLQHNICTALEAADGSAKFIEDCWQREGGGGGITKIITNGALFEKGGVNTSVVHGAITEPMKKQLQMDGHSWFACGISSVIHPINPFIPTIHFNYRFFELYNDQYETIDRWFGGGTDLTPYYLIDEDALHFHQCLKTACDASDNSFYGLFKKNCDNYFVNTHRNNERRGIGGIFYDQMRESTQKDGDFWLKLADNCANAFLPAYIPIVEKRKTTSFTAQQKYWQEIRRGRYVEFNLIHDKGTLFGLKTNGRTESILMSLPPAVRFEYNYKPAAGTEEDKLLQVCLQPKEWI